MSLIDKSKYFEQPRNDLGDPFFDHGWPSGQLSALLKLPQLSLANPLKPGVKTLRPRQNGRHFPNNIFKCIFTQGQIWPPGFVVACVCVFVCSNHEFVCVITHHPFKLGSANLDQIEVQNKLVKIPIVLWDI